MIARYPLFIACLAIFAAGCASSCSGDEQPAGEPRIKNMGPVSTVSRGGAPGLRMAFVQGDAGPDAQP